MDIYTWEDNRLFVNGVYRAILESKTDDDGICHHVTALCNEAEQINHDYCEVCKGSGIDASGDASSTCWNCFDWTK